MPDKIDWKDVLSNYIALIIEVEGFHSIKSYNRHAGFTDEQWEALVELSKEYPNSL